MNYKHGMSRHGAVTRTYRCWQQMRRRCNGTASSSSYYMDRGITVCDRWQSFERFVADMGECPEGKSLDRIDNNGPYCLENCRWATRLEQGNNKRNNVRLTLNGESKSVAEWARALGIPKPRIQKRLTLGWPTERVLSTDTFHTGSGRRIQRKHA